MAAPKFFHFRVSTGIEHQKFLIHWYHLPLFWPFCWTEIVMASQLRMIPIQERISPEGCETAYWERFQAEIAARVRECNVLSETLLWLITRTGGQAARVTVESSSCPGDRIDCSFDAALGRITCLPGPAVSWPLRVFEWSGKRLRCDGVEYSIASAASAVLDELVCDGGADE